jgi:hypothetical protein
MTELTYKTQLDLQYVTNLQNDAQCKVSRPSIKSSPQTNLLQSADLSSSNNIVSFCQQTMLKSILYEIFSNHRRHMMGLTN